MPKLVPPVLRLLLALAWVLSVSFALAQQPAAPSTATRGEATVSLYNRPIAVFRAPFLGLTPAERAERTQRAIADLLDRGGPGAVTVQSAPQGNVVMVDGRMALILTPEDADVLRGENLDSVTRAAVTALSRVIEQQKEARDRKRLLVAIGLSLLATVLYVLAMRLLSRLRLAFWRRATVMMERAHLAETAQGQETPFRTGVLWALRVLVWLVAVMLTYQWVVFVLLQFPRTRATGEQLGALVLGVLGRLAHGSVDALPDLAVAVAIFVLVRALIGVLGSMFAHVEQSQDSSGWLVPELARPTQRLVNIALWIFAIVMAYPYLPGANTEAFKGMSVLVGLMITLGGASLVGQAASGLILIYSRTLRVGDFVRISGEEGTVTELGMFTTRLQTGMGHEVTIPNSVAMGGVTRNFSRVGPPGHTVVDTSVTIGYDTPWRQVQAILQEAARRTPGVLQDPKPWVVQTALSDFYVEYRLVGRMDAAQHKRGLVLSMLNANVLDVFNEEGVQIMSPHYEGDPEQAKVVGAAHAYAASAGRPVAA